MEREADGGGEAMEKSSGGSDVVRRANDVGVVPVGGDEARRKAKRALR